MNFHLLFEQSGTFKKVLQIKGHNAYDYDILNDFNETDYQLDLFHEIEKEYNNIINGFQCATVFTRMTAEKDFIIAFFPCTYFCEANDLLFKLNIAGKKLDFNKTSCERLLKRNKDRAYYFELLLKFCLICKVRRIKTIIENPASGGKSNYLVKYLPIDVGWYEKDRSLFGDDFKKPTNFFSINFNMKENFFFFDKNIYIKAIRKDARGITQRSMISPRYVENFYSRFLEKQIS